MADRSVVVRLIADTSSYNSNMRGASRTTRDLGAAGSFAEDRLSSLKRVAAGFAVAGIVKAGIDFDALKQRSTAAFTTITGSAATAKKELTDLYAQFKNNPFGYPQILRTSQQLLAMGTPTKDLIREVRDLSDATAAVGGNAELLDRVALAFGQMRSKGTIQAEEMRQLAENGIPAWQLLAKEIGVSIPEAMKLVERRMVTSDMGIPALMQGIEGRFGGSTANLRNTWTGTLQAFKTEAIQAGGEIVKPLMRIGTDGMHALEPLLQGVGTVGDKFAGLPTPIQNTSFALLAVMLMSGRLNSAWAGLTGTGVRFAEQMRVQQALAASSGAQIGRMSAAMAVARMRAGAMGAGMLSAFGGPFGLAIIGATIGLSIYQSRQQAAAAAVAKHRAEVQALTNDLDRNTLAMKANSADQALGALSYGSHGKDGRGYSTLAYLNSIPGAADLARKAITGNLTALRQLKALLDKVDKTGPGPYVVFDGVARSAHEAHEAAKQVADEMGLRIPDAAKKAGVSADVVYNAFRNWRTSGGQLTEQLKAAGLTSSQAAIAFNMLAGSGGNVAAGLSAAALAARQMRADVAAAAGQFVNVGGAWDDATQAAQQAMTAGGSGGGAPKVGDDPAVRATRKAYNEQYAQLRALKQADKDRIAGVKEAAAADAAAATAADKRAAALKRTADAAKSASEKAQEALKKAQDAKADADRNAHDAAALAAAIADGARHAGTSDTSAWQAAGAKANVAASSTAQTQAAAGLTLNAAAAEAAARKVTETTATAAANQAKAEAAALRARATMSKAIYTRMAKEIDKIESASERRHEQLLAAKNKAEQRAQARTDAYTDSVGGSYSSMSKKVNISLNEYLNTLESQVTAQRNWKNNLLELASKVPPGIAQELAKLGPQAAPLIQKLVNGSKTQLARFVRLYGQTGKDATTAISNQLTDGIPLIAAVGRSAGQAAADKLAAALAGGKTTVAKAMKTLNATVGENPLDVKLGLKGKGAIDSALYDLAHPKHPNLVPVTLTLPHSSTYRGHPAIIVKGSAGSTTIAFKEGGWVRGGSRRRDDVPLPSRIPGVQPMAMGGEFVVKQSLAQANKPFFDYLDRTGRMPAPAAAPSPTYVMMPSSAPTKTVTNIFQPGAIVQQPGTSARDLVREIDRLADLGAGP